MSVGVTDSLGRCYRCHQACAAAAAAAAGGEATGAARSVAILCLHTVSTLDFSFSYRGFINSANN